MKIFPRIFATIFYMTVVFPSLTCAADGMKLPYAAGERFIVSAGYNTPPTHIKKDSYAIDFAQDGCGAYGKLAIAAFSGTAWIVDENGYNGGYGTQLLILSAGNVVTRYAHMIPGSIPVQSGEAVPQGTVVGEIGDTGLVAGNACADHPGTHIHFAAYTENADGSFSAKSPEPISDYAGIAAEHWYVSDNVLAATKGNLAALFAVLNDLLGSNASVISPSNPTVAGTAVSSNISLQGVSHASSSSPLESISSAPSSPSAFQPDVSSSSENVMNLGVVSTSMAEPVASSSSSGGGSAPASSGGIAPGGVSGSFGVTGEPYLNISTSNSSIVPSSTSFSADDPADDSIVVCQ